MSRLYKESLGTDLQNRKVVFFLNFIIPMLLSLEIGPATEAIFFTQKGQLELCKPNITLHETYYKQ